MVWIGGPDGSSCFPCCGGKPESGEGSGIPIQGGTVGVLQVAGQSTEEAFSSFSGRRLSAPPHKLGEPGLPRGRVAEGLETALEKIKLHLRANSIRE